MKSHRQSSDRYSPSAGALSVPGRCANGFTTGIAPPVETWPVIMSSRRSLTSSGIVWMTPSMSCTVSRYPSPSLSPLYTRLAARDHAYVMRQLYGFHMFSMLLRSLSGVRAVIPPMRECQWDLSLWNSSRTLSGEPDSRTAALPSEPALPIPIRTTSSFDSPGRSVTSTCRAVLPINRNSCVSVAILVGMRLRIATRIGRMSWCAARSSPMTKTFSLSSVARAGRLAGILTGIGDGLRPVIDCPFYHSDAAAPIAAV